MRLNRRPSAPPPADPRPTNPAGPSPTDVAGPSSPGPTPGRAGQDNRPPSTHAQLGLRVQLVLTLAVAALVGSASVGHADPVHVVALANSLSDVLTNIRNWILGILVALTIVFATLGGLKWLMATEPGDAEKAKSALKNAGIGFVLAVLAPLLVEALRSIVGGP